MEKNEELATMTAERYQLFKDHLTVITNGLIEMARAAGRTKCLKNQLLLECYNLGYEEVLTEDDWNAKGAYVKHGEHAYMFWKASEVEFRFARSQVKFEEITE